MQEIFEQFSHPQLKGTLIWAPMMANDGRAAAKAQQAVFQDSRVQHYWDPEKILGKIVANPLLKNTPIAWDIYLLFNPGTQWDNEIFPAPDFWMHRLPEDESLRLNPEILQQQVLTAVHNLVIVQK